jgi:hypothetical protein
MWKWEDDGSRPAQAKDPISTNKMILVCDSRYTRGIGRGS